MDESQILWNGKLEQRLVSPYMLMTLHGWSNAGQVPSAVSWYILRKLKTRIFAEFKPDEFYVYLSSGSEAKRPVVDIEEGIIKSLSVVTTNLSLYQDSKAEHDLIVVSGPEPEQKWIRYTGILLDLAQELGVQKIISIGGMFDSIPHTVPPRISAVMNDPSEKASLKALGIEPISYRGPSSISSLFLVEAAKRELKMISLWAHSPHYIQVLNFIACYHMLLKLNEILKINLDLQEAKRDSDLLYAQIDKAIVQKPELQEQLKILEIEYRKGKLRQSSISQNLIKEIEDLLKRSQSQE